MSQRARVLWVIALAILPLVALAGLSVWLQLRDDEQRIASERVNLARAASLATQLFIEGNIATARSLALHPAFSRPATPEFSRFLEDVVRENPGWEGIGVIGPRGETRLSSRGPAVTVADRPYFKEAVSTGRPVVSPALIGRRSRLPTVVIAVPVDYPDGRGIVAVPISSPRLSQHLVRRIGTPSVHITVIDKEGKAFIGPDPARAGALESLKDRPEAAAVLDLQTASLVADLDGIPTLFAFSPVNPFDWGIVLSEPVSSAFAAARKGAWERAAVLAAILLVVCWLAWHFSGQLASLYERAERARAEAEAAREQLQHSLATRDEFLAAASHDLRNPLAAIKGAADVMESHLRRAGNVPPDRLAACLENIGSAARRMAKLIDGFLDVAHIHAGRALELDLRQTDLVPVLRRMVEESRQAAAKHVLVLRAEQPVLAEIDVARIERVVGNLLDNAIKYSPAGGTVEVRAWEENGSACFSVRDEGVGIPLEDRERLFTRFQRGSNVVGRFAGTGIGLAGSRHIVEQHGGSMDLQTQVGAGTTWTVRLRPSGRPG